MKYEEAINRPDGEAWKQEVKNKHDQIIKHEVWISVKKVKVQWAHKIFKLSMVHEKESEWDLKRQVDSTWMQSE